jgi:hypothetical protein
MPLTSDEGGGDATGVGDSRSRKDGHVDWVEHAAEERQQRALSTAVTTSLRTLGGDHVGARVNRRTGFRDGADLPVHPRSTPVRDVDQIPAADRSRRSR